MKQSTELRIERPDEPHGLGRFQTRERFPRRSRRGLKRACRILPRLYAPSATLSGTLISARSICSARAELRDRNTLMTDDSRRTSSRMTG